MKKLLRILSILIVLASGFLYIVKNPELPISEKILTTLGIDMSTDETETMDLTDCLSYFDGCNTCMVSGGIIGGCTKMFCQEPAEPQCLEYVWTGMDLSGCVSYFDGCNNCSVENGRPSTCTEMYCETPSEPKCIEYATGSESTGEIQKEVINTDFVNDGTSVSYKGIKINVDASSFKLLSDIFFKDKNSIYTMAYIGDGEYTLKKMDTINPSTFQIINDMFVKDDIKVYVVDDREDTRIIPLQADVNSSYVSSKFPEILSDKDNVVYYLNNKFTGISMQELENRITKHGTDFIIANNKVYINITEMGPLNEYILLTGADTQTFKKSTNINGSRYEDKNNKYDFFGVIISGTIKQLTGSEVTGDSEDIPGGFVEQASKNITDVNEQFAKIRKIFQQDGKRYGTFQYIQYGDCDGPCREYITGLELIIEINTEGGFFYYGSPVFLDNGNGDLNLQKKSFDERYTNIHPYGETNPKNGVFNDVYIIDIQQGVITKIETQYQA